MTDKKHEVKDKRSGGDANRDPITGEKGSHPVGTGVGAAGGAASGAAIGTAVGGPIGLAVGGVAGAIVGGLAGKGVAEAMDPTKEDEYWRENYSSRPYAKKETNYETLEPAYRYGWESRGRQMDSKWNDAEQDLSKGWDKARGQSKMAWNDAKDATRDAWDHVGQDDDGGAMRNHASQADGGLNRSGMDKKRV